MWGSKKFLWGAGTPETQIVRCVAVEAIAKYQIVAVTSIKGDPTAIPSTELGLDGLYEKVSIATGATRGLALGKLYVALAAATAANDIVPCTPITLMKNLDTSGALQGDPVYLSTAGAPSLNPHASFQRQIGEVVTVGALGTGVWAFAPHLVRNQQLLGGVQTIDMADAQVALVRGTAGAGQVRLLGRILFVDANSGATEDLLLPPEAGSAGEVLFIVNTGGEDIVVKEDSDTTTIATISTTECGLFTCDGTSWKGGVITIT